MKKILIITDSFPSTGGGRTDKFVKYLRDFDCDPIILSTWASNNLYKRKLLRDEFPSTLRIHRAASLTSTPFRILSRYFNFHETTSFLERLFFIPDLAITWVPHAVFVGLKLLKNKNIDLIYSTSPPESTHIIGLILSKITGKKWVADFRDLWTQKKVAYRPPTRLHHKLCTGLEEYIFSNADQIIANTEENKTCYLSKLYTPKAKITVITNGYDPKDLSLSSGEIGFNKDCFNIGYMGTFDKRDFPWRQFLFALKKLIKVKPEAKLRVNIYGEQPSNDVIRFVEENRLSNYIIFHGAFSHSDAVKLTAQNDMLLLLLYETDYSSAIVPLKLYSYLIMGKPIFAVCPEHGATAKIIEETNTGKCVSPYKHEQIFRSMVEYYEEWMTKGKIHFSVNSEKLSKYDGRLLTKKLARVFDRILDASQADNQ